MTNLPSVARQDLQIFSRRFRRLIFLCWTIPAIFGLSFLIYINMFTLEQMAVILSHPLEPLFVVFSLLGSLAYYCHLVKPIKNYLRQANEENARQAVHTLRRFPLHFWTGFLIYLLIAPSTVMLSAHWYAGVESTPTDWFRIHLVALIVSILVGLPIFFRIFDLFGHAVGDIKLTKPILSINSKIFLIGALMPLLIDTMLVQYYWSRTGYFTAEAFGVWLFLELLAIAGSLLFIRSTGQSIAPLQTYVLSRNERQDGTTKSLTGHSTDELGLLTNRYHDLLQQIDLDTQILELRNRILRSSGPNIPLGEILDNIVKLAEQALLSDTVFIMLHEPEHYRLNGICMTGAPWPFSDSLGPNFVGRLGI